MMQNEQIADSVLRQIRSEDFTNGVYRQIVDLISKNRQQNHAVQAAHLIDLCDSPQLAQVLSDVSLEPGVTPGEGELPLDDYIRRFKTKALEQQLDALESRLRQSLPPEELRAVMEQHRELTIQRRAMLASGTPQKSR